MMKRMNESFVSDDEEGTIMEGSSDDEDEAIERKSVPEHPLEMLSDLAQFTESYGRIDLAEIEDFRYIPLMKLE
jgi:hypothetical protein